MTFIMQIYCPINDDTSRTLYIFVCMEDACLLSNPCYRVLRVQKKFEKVTEIPIVDSESDWGFGDSKSESAKSEPAQIHADDRESFQIESRCTSNSYFVDFYQNEYNGEFQIDSDDEELDNDTELTLYLSSETHHSKEVILYNRGGQPIISKPSTLSAIADLRCTSCGSAVVFEAQIFPNINNFLSKDDEWPLYFDNALIYTCSQSCGEVVEETIVVETSDNKIM